MASTPPHPPAADPGASQADARDELRSRPAPGRLGTGRACLHGGRAECRQTERTALADTPPDSRRVLGACRGSGASCPTGACSRMLGRGGFTLSSSLGDSTWGGPGPPHPQGGPLPAPHGVSPGSASTPPQRDQLGKELVPPRGGTEVIIGWGQSLTTRWPGDPGPRAEPPCGRKAGVPVPALAPVAAASAHAGLSFPIHSPARRRNGPVASQPASRHSGGDGLSPTFLPSQSAPVRPGAWRGQPGPPGPPGTLPGALNARLLASAGSGADGPSPRQRPARASGAARGALGAACEPGRGRRGQEHGAGESRASCSPPAVAPALRDRMALSARLPPDAADPSSRDTCAWPSDPSLAGLEGSSHSPRPRELCTELDRVPQGTGGPTGRTGVCPAARGLQLYPGPQWLLLHAS